MLAHGHAKSFIATSTALGASLFGEDIKLLGRHFCPELSTAFYHVASHCFSFLVLTVSRFVFF